MMCDVCLPSFLPIYKLKLLTITSFPGIFSSPKRLFLEVVILNLLKLSSLQLISFHENNNSIIIIIIIIIIIYNLYRGKAPVTRSDFQGDHLRVKIKIQ